MVDSVNEWDSSFSFLMAMIGAAVGLGNIWRYPYVVYTNGGGSFLIPYLFAILVLGVPFLLLEYGVGFKFKTSLANVLKSINRRFEFLGWFVALATYLLFGDEIFIVGFVIWLFLFIL